MKMRLMGSSEEMQEVVDTLQNTFDVQSVSKEYPNRGISTDVRVYIDFDMKISSNELLSKENCCRNMYDTSVETNEGYIAILKPEILCDCDRTKDFQLVRLTGGFGCDPNALGNACYVRFCIDGTKTRIERYDILGIADEETAKYAEKLECNLIELLPREKEILEECLNDKLEMFKALNEYFDTEETNSLYTKFKNLNNKLSKPGKQYFFFDEVELMNLLTSLSSYAELEIAKVKNRGENPKEDRNCLFLNSLYIKLNDKFLSM